MPLDEIVRFLTTLAPRGVIGFVPRGDARAAALFRGREAIFQDYTLDNFVQLLSRHGRIVNRRDLPGTERVLLAYVSS